MDTNVRHQGANVVDVLRQLSVPALEIFLETINNQSGFGRVRLVCRALRELVDSTVTELCLSLTSCHQGLWEAGSRPPILPRLRVLKLWLRHDASRNGSASANMLPSIVQGLPAAVQQGGITSLLVTGIDSGYPAPYSTLSGVISYLPALKEVNVGSRNHLLVEPQQLALLYDKLANLPVLESLTAPTITFVEHLLNNGAVAANTLKRLVLGGGPIDATTAAAIQSLQQLTHLRITDYLPDVKPLLDALPPRLEELDQPSYTLTLSSGTITAVCVKIDLGLSDRNGPWVEQLLKCPAMPQRLERVSLTRIRVPAEEVSDAVRQLLSRSQEVAADTVLLESEVTDDVIQGVLQLLGRWPGGFMFNFVSSCADIEFCSVAVPWAGAPFTTQLLQTAAESPQEALKEHLSARIQSIWAQPRFVCDPSSESLQSNGVSQPVSGGSSCSAGKASISNNTSAFGQALTSLQGGIGPVLLLRGSHMAELASTPGSLDEWMQSLWPEATSAARQAEPGGGIDPELDEWPSEGSYLQLTEDGDVLACFSHAKFAAAFAKLATAAVGESTGTMPGPSAAPAVQAVLGKEATYGCTNSEAQTIADLLILIMEPMLQQLWDERCRNAAAEAEAAGADSSGRGGPELNEALSRAGLMQLRETLNLIVGMQELSEGEKQLE